jgi:hypothetical protein
MFKKSKLFLTLALAFIMCFASVTPSLAGLDSPAASTSQAAITKLLKVPKGTAIPNNMTFKFSVTAVAMNGDNSADSLATAASAVISDNGIVSITFNGSQKQKAPVDTDINTYYLESAGLFDVSKYPSPGIYSYRIKENANTYTINDPLHEALTYSLAEYDVQVYVKKDTNGLVIAYIGVIREINDDGTELEDSEKDKLDPTPGGNPSHEFGYSEMTFTNKYIKTNGPVDPDVPDPTDPDDSTLNVSKTVTGIFGSTIKYFDFTLTLTLPDLIASYLKPYYAAYLVQGNVIIDPVNNADSTIIGTATDGTKFIKFAPGAETHFKLRDGQKLMFVNTPVGTKYSVTEAAAVGYTPKTSVIYNNGTPQTATGTLTNIPFSVNNAYIGEAANSAAFINDSGTTTPTGLDLNDLPFIGLIALAIGALVLFVVIKSRKQRNASQY